MLFSKLVVVLAGIGAVLVATAYAKAGDVGVLSTVFMLYAIFSGGIAGMFLLGLFVRRANKPGTYIGIAACVIFTGIAILTSTYTGEGEEKSIMLDLGPLNYTHHKYMLGVYSHLVLFFVGWFASYLFPKSEVPKNLTYYGYREKKIKGKI